MVYNLSYICDITGICSGNIRCFGWKCEARCQLCIWQLINKRAKGANKKKCPVTEKGGRGVKPLFITLESRGLLFWIIWDQERIQGGGKGSCPHPPQIFKGQLPPTQSFKREIKKGKIINMKGKRRKKVNKKIPSKISEISVAGV